MARSAIDPSVRRHSLAAVRRRAVQVLTPALALAAAGVAADAEAAPRSGCAPQPSCEAAGAPEVGPRRRLRHRRSRLVMKVGRPNHRGRDLLLRPGDRQMVIGKIAYGLADKDLVDEEVDLWLLRGCGGTWERLGTAITTADGDHAEEEGVADSGGRVYFPIPPERALGPGRHRIHMSVAGDRTGADLIIHVAPPGTHVFVADVDGTLTTSGTAEIRTLLAAKLPMAHAGAPGALQTLAARGYLPVYLSSRPELLLNRTREFLTHHGFPPGVVVTTSRKSGALGSSAARFKTAELARMLTARGFVAAFAFGNTASDAAAYASSRVRSRLFYRFTDASHGGRRFESYEALETELAGTPDRCPP